MFPEVREQSMAFLWSPGVSGLAIGLRNKIGPDARHAIEERRPSLLERRQLQVEDVGEFAIGQAVEGRQQELLIGVAKPHHRLRVREQHGSDGRRQ